MKSIGFIGAYDKSDLIINIAKVLEQAGQKVLVVDATILQKTRYIVPAIQQTRAYLTTFERVDFAVGFKSSQELQQYFAEIERRTPTYDIALIDVDTRECFTNFGLVNSENNFFVTSYDLYSVKKGLSIFIGLENPIKLTKILFAKNTVLKQEEYIDSIAIKFPVSWSNKIYLPFEEGDQTTNIENQYTSKITFRSLTLDYKDALILVLAEIVPEIDTKKIIKSL